MKITVLGSGIIGITTAYFLAKNGHQVTVIDKLSSSGRECSYSNGAQISYSSAQPWANRGALLKGLKWMGKKDAPLRFRLLPDIKMYIWLAKFVLNCNKYNEAKNTKNILDLCLYSRDILHKHEKEFDFNFEFLKEGGRISIFESQEDLDGYHKQCQLQEILGAPYQLLNREEVFEYEPALKHMHATIVGGMREPLDESGDCYKFCVGMENKLRDMGVEFKFDSKITDFKKDGKKIIAVVTDKGEIESDMFVMSLGAYSTELAKKLGISLPMYPLKGYSITIDVKNKEVMLKNSVTYYGARTVFTPLGDKMRVSGTAEFAGYDHSISKERIDMLKRFAREVVPDCGDIDAAEEYACLRPATPNGCPIIGHSKYDNMVLNTGQGSLGWTMAFASAKLTADIIEGKPTEIDAAPYKL